MLMRRKQKRRSSRAYILDALVCDNIENVQRIVEQEVASVAAKRGLKLKWDACY